jgi:hypothetical protein
MSLRSEIGKRSAMTPNNIAGSPRNKNTYQFRASSIELTS